MAWFEATCPVLPPWKKAWNHHSVVEDRLVAAVRPHPHRVRTECQKYRAALIVKGGHGQGMWAKLASTKNLAQPPF